MAQSICRRLINALANAPTAAIKGDLINQSTFYLNLPTEPTGPSTIPIWTDIRTSRITEVFLQIVTNPYSPMTDGEAHLRVSSLQALRHIVLNMQWDHARRLESQLREKVVRLCEELRRLEGHNFAKPDDL
ncbi:hypothetical protein FRB90_000207, partial [Tulasnella sp. 427]